MSSLLPQTPGLLPYWLLFISLTATGNTIQSFLTLNYTSQVYANGNGPSASTSAPAPAPTSSSTKEKKLLQLQVTPLQSRTFGTWTFLSAVIRFYAAYDITNPQLYQLTLWTFGIVWLHFVGEWFVWGTVRWNRGSAGPLCIATGTGLWMLSVWGQYVG